MSIREDKLIALYQDEKKSVNFIAKQIGCSENKVNYYLAKYGIKKRTISEAVYIKHNPNGDPFSTREEFTNQDHFLFGLGLGLYWGEGNKMNKNAIRLGNTDPELLAVFIKFLERIYGVDRMGLRFGIQIFNDMDPETILRFWIKKLGVKKNQFYKTTVTLPRGKGTYKKKVDHGVLTVHFNNTKLRNMIIGKIENIRKMY